MFYVIFKGTVVSSVFSLETQYSNKRLNACVDNADKNLIKSSQNFLNKLCHGCLSEMQQLNSSREWQCSATCSIKSTTVA